MADPFSQVLHLSQSESSVLQEVGVIRVVWPGSDCHDFRLITGALFCRYDYCHCKSVAEGDQLAKISPPDIFELLESEFVFRRSLCNVALSRVMMQLFWIK